MQCGEICAVFLQGREHVVAVERENLPPERGIAGGVTVLDDYAHHPTAVRETLKALRKRFPKRRLIAVYEPRSATSRRKTFQGEFADAFAYADEVIVGKMFDASKIPAADRFDPEKLALDLHRGGTKASYIAETDAIVKQLAESAAPGDVVVVLSSGSFDGLHDKLLDAIGDAMRPAQRADMAAVRATLAAVGLAEPARDEQFPTFFVLPAVLIVAWIVSATDSSESANKERALFDAQKVRSETGLGAEMAAAH